MQNLFKKWKNIYLIQLVINLAIVLYFLLCYDITSLTDLSFKTTIEDGVCVFILFIALITNLIDIKNKPIEFCFNWLSIIAIPFIFIYSLAELANVLGDNTPQFHNLTQVIYLFLSLILFIPFTKIELKKVDSPRGKIISFIFFFLNLTTFSQYADLTKVISILSWLSSSRILNAIAFLISVKIILRNKLNIKWNKNTKPQLWVIFLLVAFGIWFSFFVQFIGNAHSFSEALWNWTNFFNSIDFTYFDFNYENILSALTAGIIEESMRCFNLVLLLIVFKNSKNQLLSTVLISSLIFALLHYTHLVEPERNLYNVSLQVIYTFGFGCFLAVAYLYTGQFWFAVLIHFLFDYLAFSTTLIARTDTGFLFNYDNGLLETLFIVLFPLVITIFMFFGQRKKIMVANIQSFKN